MHCNDTCFYLEFEADGVCDVPHHCLSGTDCADCTSPPTNYFMASVGIGLSILLQLILLLQCARRA